MSDYTPDTKQVRASADWGAFTSPDEFDRWLVKFDAEVVRQERQRITEIILNDNVYHLLVCYNLEDTLPSLYEATKELQAKLIDQIIYGRGVA